MALTSPLGLMMALSGSGMLAMEAVCTLCKAIVVWSNQWSFPQMALASPLGLGMAPSGSGMLAMQAVCTPWKAIVIGSSQWSFPRMALALPPDLGMAPSGSGMPVMEPASKSWTTLNLLHCLTLALREIPHGQEHPTSKRYVKRLSIPLMVWTVMGHGSPGMVRTWSGCHQNTARAPLLLHQALWSLDVDQVGFLYLVS